MKAVLEPLPAVVVGGGVGGGGLFFLQFFQVSICTGLPVLDLVNSLPVQNQPSREIISIQKTSCKHYKDLGCLW